MKRIPVILILLCSSPFAFSQYNDNPVCGCKITKEYGTVYETYYLKGPVHYAKDGEFAELKIFVVKDGGYANMTIKFVDFNPRFCGEWHLTENKGYAIKFVDSPEKANFTVKFGEPAEVYGFHGEPH